MSEGDLVAIEAQYHAGCLAKLYNRVRDHDSKTKTEKEGLVIQGIVEAEIVEYIWLVLDSVSETPVFRLCDLLTLYKNRMVKYGSIEMYIHPSRFKERLLYLLPELSAIKKGREILLTVSDRCGHAIYDACDFKNDGVCLVKATIIRKHILNFREENQNELSINVLNGEKNVPRAVQSFVSMLIHGTGNFDDDDKENDEDDATNKESAIAQLLCYNTKKRQSKNKKTHQLSKNETPLPQYIGLMIHAKTRQKNLINDLASFGISIPYQRVLSIQEKITKKLCQNFKDENLVCPPRLKHGLFTTAAIDNLDHNLSSTTAPTSFHGTGISIFQHADSEISPNTANFSDLDNYDTCDACDATLPQYYTLVKPAKSGKPDYPQ